MPLILWEEKLSVNVAEIDEQHQKIIAIINHFHDTLLNKNITELDIDQDNLPSEVETTLVEHFLAEETFMERMDYPHLEEHRKKHEEFLSRLRRYKEDIKQGSYPSTAS